MNTIHKNSMCKHVFLTARKWLFAILTSLPLGGLGWALTSCDDFFEQETNDVLFADKEHLNNAVDTAWSVSGILYKLQGLADRTVILGEVRGDLVDLTQAASSDLRDVANFNIGDDNAYNYPSDYYAVINNCNYYIEHVDTALRSTTSVEPIFMAEYAAVKSIRAWTYLQLALNYGRVPLFTEPLLSREAAEAAEKGTTAGIEDICTFFINDLATLPERYNTYYPLSNVDLGAPGGSRQLFFPLSLMRGELYLWRASVTGSVSDYRQAALQYFKFISERNGTNTAYPTSLFRRLWIAGTTAFDFSYGSSIMSYSDNPITVIVGAASKVNGFYSELRDLFSSTSKNDYKVSIEPSQRMFDLSAAQDYCLPSRNGTSFTFAPKGLTDYQSGDLRLSHVYSESEVYDSYTEERIRTKHIGKHENTDVTLYRGITVYLHLAEALNGAGYPRMAYLILSKGLSNKVIKEEAMPYYMTDDRADSLFLAQFNFDDGIYEVATVFDFAGSGSGRANQLGVHSRGAGYTPMNTNYVLPNDTIEPDPQKRAQLVAEQQVVVDSLLLNEEALELAFEGTRYYDLMRFAFRQDNPAAFMAHHITARRGEELRQEVQAELKTNFTDRSTWFLKWNGKIGY